MSDDLVLRDEKDGLCILTLNRPQKLNALNYDVFKALAMGATAVGIGRPQVWGLAAFGQPGVEAVLDIYARELRVIMRQAGTPSITAISPDHIVNKLSAS